MPRPFVMPGLCLALTLCLSASLPSTAAAQTAAPTAAPASAATTTQTAVPADAPVILGQPLTLSLGAPTGGTDCPAAAATLNTQGLVLVANAQTIPNARASFTCSDKGELLGTATTSIAGNGDEAAARRQAWQSAFNGFFNLAGTKTIPMAFGPSTGGMTTPPKMLTIQGANNRDMTLAALWFVVIIAVFLLAYRRHFGRDTITTYPDVPMPDGYVPPYSLSRFQLLWWSAIVTASYAAILTITGSMDTISTGTMVLMGIVGGTSVLAAFQDNQPSGGPDGDDAHIAQHRADYRAAAQAVPPDITRMASSVAAIYPASEGMLPDMLSDAHGYNVHRLQLLAWTIVLGVTFLYEVTRTLGMPELSANLLALTGISNGTYFGFKMQEQQVTPPTTAS